MVQVTARFIDDLKIIPRIMMLAVTVLTYQSVHWYMALPDPSIQQSGLVSVMAGALTGCFGIFLGRESKTTTVTPNKVVYEQSYSNTSDK